MIRRGIGPIPDGPISWRWVGPMAGALILGLVGGAVFDWARMPLAWMIGPLVFTMAAAMAGARLRVPEPLRGVMIMVLGVLLGSGFTPDLLARLDDWLVTIGMLVVYIIVSLSLGVILLRRVFGDDPVTAFFTAAPGGFTEMVLAGAAYGGDERRIALVHSLRITLVVLIVPLWFQWWVGFERTGSSALGPAIGSIGLIDGLLLVGCAVGAWPARKLGLPAPHMFGPMILSAAIHLGGLTASKPPAILVAAAMLVVGSSIGCRFVGVSLRTLASGGGAALAVTALMLMITALFAGLLAMLTGLDWTSILLGYAPGGFAEMSLISLALGIDPAFVATHHMARIMLIIAFAPILFRIWHRMVAPKDKGVTAGRDQAAAD